MNRKLQVFVSSTYTDLRVERQAAVSAILEVGHIPAGMELFASGDESQLETILRWIEESDVFMLILGARYGSIEPNSKRSYVEVECDHAIEKEKPYFAVVLDEAALEEREASGDMNVVEHDRPDSYQELRKKVLSRTSSFFREAKDIKLEIYKSLRNLDKDPQITGWIQTDKAPDIRPLVKQIGLLQEENASLRAEVDNLRASAAQVSPGEEDAETEHLRILLGRFEVDVPGRFSDGRKRSVLTIFYANREAFTVGLLDTPDSESVAHWLFGKVGSILQAHDLVTAESLPPSSTRRLVLTPLGAKLLAWVDRRVLKHGCRLHLLERTPTVQ